MKLFDDNIVVREARPEDVPAMIALERCAETAAHWRNADYSQIFEPNGVARLALVVEKDGISTGFLVASVVAQGWEIENVVVADNAKRCGLGSKLVREVVRMAQARAGQSISLEVRESNNAARRLYERHMFQTTGRRRAYYQNPPEDAIIYRLELRGE